MKTAIVTGLKGQIGSYLTEQLISNGYKVYGLIRRSSNGLDLGQSSHLENNPNLEVVEGDLLDLSSLTRLCSLAKADLFFNMAAQSVHPDTYIHIHRPSHYTDSITIAELWQKCKIGLASHNSQYTQEIVVSNNLDQPEKVEVINLPKNTQLCTLGFRGGMGQWFPIKQISRHKYKGKLINLRQKWGEVRVTPNHSVYNINGKLVSPITNPELLPMRKINYYNSAPKYNIILPTRDRKGKEINEVKQNLSTEDGSLEAFLRFCGAFIAEGWTTKYLDKKNKNYFVCISQSNRKWLEELQLDLKKFYSGSSWICKHKKEKYEDCFRLECNNHILYSLMRKLCGIESSTKCIPKFFISLDISLWHHLLDKLYEGDGNKIQLKHDTSMRYSTASPKLISQLGLIWSLLGKDYSYNRYEHKNKSWHDKFELKQVHFYQTNKGNQDYKEIYYDGYVYDISVDEVHNFVVAPGNVVVHNSHVGSSFEQPIYTAQCTGLGVLNCLEAVRLSGIHTRFLQASTSEMFGDISNKPCNEQTPFYPRSPYGVAKLFAHHMVVNYRESYKMFACCSICFNNESSRRGPNFVTRKITMAIAKIKAGLQDKLYLGNLDAKRDWGFSGNYSQGMIAMLTRSPIPKDYVLATGETHTVREFCEIAFSLVGLDYRDYVEIDPRFYRPAEVDVLIGDYSAIEKDLGWVPMIKFPTLVEMMVEHDIQQLRLATKTV